jgi:hypothetical protein
MKRLLKGYRMPYRSQDDDTDENDDHPIKPGGE